MYINTLNEYLKNKYGCKMYKLTISSGLSCPNRDGSKGYGGCTFCSEKGSGDFAQSSLLSITEQIGRGKTLVQSKNPSGKYIAYFQSFTNTYGKTDYLRKIFTEAINHKDVEILSIATRPDCINEEITSLLFELNKIKPVWVELGLQTSNETTAKSFNRCFPNSDYIKACNMLTDAGIEVITHVILNLPGETLDDMINTVKYVSDSKASGIKLSLLHILKGTKMADNLASIGYKSITLEEYGNLLCTLIPYIRKDIVIHRLTGDGPKALLIDPLWTADKKRVLNHINSALKQNNTTQGSAYPG